MLSRLAYSFSQDQLIQFTQGLILSKIRYGLALYGAIRMSESCPQDQSMHSLEVAINDAMHVIMGSRRRDRVPIVELRNETKLPSLNQLIVQSVLTEAWKIQHGLSTSIEDLMTPIKNRNMTTQAASQGHVRVPVASNRLTFTSFSYKAATLWNDAPADILEEAKVSPAKRKIKEYAGSFP